MSAKEVRKQEIAKKIKNLRIESGLTQLQVAEKLGITYQAVSNYERGKNSIEIDVLLEMCNIYNADPASVLDIDVKGEVYNILYSENSTLEEKCAAALGLFHIYFSRSTKYNFNSFNHPDFNSYVAMLLNQNQFRERFGEDVYAALVQEYGKKPGIPEGYTTYQLERTEKSKLPSFALSKDEQSHIKKYRLLDPYGKEAVDGVLDVEWRRCTEQTPVKQERTPKVITLNRPYVQVAAAEGAGAFLLDDGHDEVRVELNKYTQKADVILKVLGRSMEPAIYDGDHILVRLQPSVEIGEVGVFILDGQGYLKEAASDRLVSLNPDVDDVLVGDMQKVECYGKFIAVLAPEWVVEE